MGFCFITWALLFFLLHQVSLRNIYRRVKIRLFISFDFGYFGYFGRFGGIRHPVLLLLFMYIRLSPVLMVDFGMGICTAA